jgi:type III secretory pathway component EscS
LLFPFWSLLRDHDLRLFVKLLGVAIIASYLTYGWPGFIVFEFGGGGFF